MALISETISASQKASFEAVASFTDSCFGVVERLTQLNIDVTRATVEKSSEMGLFFWEASLLQGNVASWHSALQSGIEQFSEYCQDVRAITQEAAKD